MRNWIETAWYLVFWKLYSVAGRVDTAYWNAWIFQHGVVFDVTCASARSEDFRKSQQIDTYNLYFKAIKIYGQFFNQYICLTISNTYAIFYPWITQYRTYFMAKPIFSMIQLTFWFSTLLPRLVFHIGNNLLSGKLKNVPNTHYFM